MDPAAEQVRRLASLMLKQGPDPELCPGDYDRAFLRLLRDRAKEIRSPEDQSAFLRDCEAAPGAHPNRTITANVLRCYLIMDNLHSMAKAGITHEQAGEIFRANLAAMQARERLEP